MESKAVACLRSGGFVLAVVLAQTFAVGGGSAATLTVTGTGDTVAVDGLVTLREAMASINGAASVNADILPVGIYGSGDLIQFNIGGGGPQTITVGASPLPTMNVPVQINGYSQPGSVANTLAVGDNALLNVILRGTTAGVHGLTFFQGASGSIVRGLVLQNHFFALQIQASNVSVAGNFIGTDRTGTTAEPNAIGVNVTNGNLGNNVIGGSTPADRNVISGNTGSAIVMNSQLSNTIRGNYIGITSAGSAALPNQAGGIVIATLGAATIGGPDIGGATSQAGTGAGNVISGNGGVAGIQIHVPPPPTVISGGNIHGNLIGLDATGATAIPNTGAGISLEDSTIVSFGDSRLGPVDIGGSVAGSGNVISGHGNGILARSDGVRIRGNFIGTDITGTLARPNTFGIELSTMGGFAVTGLIGGDTAVEGNTISGNSSDGVRVFRATVTMRRNRIGVSATDAALGNGGFGVFIDSGLATLGTTNAAHGNTIANNGDTGVQVRIGFPEVRDASDAAIQGNRIFSNGVVPLAGLGINNSAPDVVTANDAGDGDTGPNGLQNFPVLTAATIAGGNLTVSGTLNSVANVPHRVEIFSSAACDPFGFGEGQSFLGGFTVLTDIAGNAAFNPAPLAIPAGQTRITATATNASGQTSEFSQCLEATGGAPLPTLAIDDVSHAEGNAGTTPFVFTVTLSAASATPVTVNWATADGSATSADNDYVPASGTVTFSPGGPLAQTIQVDGLGDLLVETNEAFVVNLSNPSAATIADGVGAGDIINDDQGGTPPSEIPTLSTWGLLLMVAGVVGVALRRMAARPV
jgi:hypothetical protein